MKLAHAVAGIVLAAAIVVPARAADIDKDIVIAVRPGLLQREKVAVPDVRILGVRTDPMLQRAAQELRDTLWDDLRYSGVFDMVARELYADLRLPTTPEKVPYEEWVAIGTSWLVLMDLSAQAGELVLEGRLFETKIDRKMVLGKRYQGGFDVARRIAHTFADVIVGQVGGEPGVATSEIVFSSDRDGGRGRELYVMDYDGHAPRRLTSTGKLNVMPDVAPGNQMVAYTSYLKNNPDLYILDRPSGKSRPVFARPGLNSSASWSPDASLIAFASSHEAGDVNLYTIRPDGTGLKRLTSSRGIDVSPAWSPGGAEIAFTSDRSGSPQIWLMDADGLNARRLTSQGSFNDGAAWAPVKGKSPRIAFAGRTAGNFQIFVYNVESGDLVQLTDQGSNEAPSWSPDGRQLAFASTRGGRSDIYVMNDDGTNVRRISSGGNNVSPAWSRR